MELRPARSSFPRFRSASFAPLAYLLLTCFANHASSAAEQVAWRNAAEVRQELEGTIGINWPANPLRNSLSNLAQARRVAIWLDRRVDPDQQIEFKVKDVSFRDALKQLASQLNCGLGLVGPVIYIGPTSTVSKLQSNSTLRREEAGKLDASLRRKLAATRAWKWDELAEPRELLKELATEGGLAIASADQVPHDLWPAGDFPALSVCDRMSLLLAGFDLTFSFSPDASSIEVRPFPQAAVAGIEKAHAVKGNVAEAAEKIASQFPAAKVRTAPGRVLVTATPEEHLQIEDLLKRPAAVRPMPGGGEKRYTIKMDLPVGSAIRALAKELKLELAVDPAVPAERLKQKTTFQVKDVTLDELLGKVLGPANLTYKITGQTLEVFDKPQ